MRMLGILIAPCLATACVVGANPVTERKEYWERIISVEIPVGADEAIIKNWAETRNIKLVLSQENHDLVGGLETIPVNNLICKDFYLDVHISLDSQGKSKREEVTSMGNCL